MTLEKNLFLCFFLAKLVFSLKPLTVESSSHKGRGRTAELGVRERKAGGNGRRSRTFVSSLGPRQWHLQVISICVQHGNTHSELLQLFRLCGEELFSCPISKKLPLAAAMLALLLGASWSCPNTELALALPQVSAIRFPTGEDRCPLLALLIPAMNHSITRRCWVMVRKEGHSTKPPTL